MNGLLLVWFHPKMRHDQARCPLQSLSDRQEDAAQGDSPQERLSRAIGQTESLRPFDAMRSQESYEKYEHGGFCPDPLLPRSGFPKGPSPFLKALPGGKRAWQKTPCSYFS